MGLAEGKHGTIIVRRLIARLGYETEQTLRHDAVIPFPVRGFRGRELCIDGKVSGRLVCVVGSQICWGLEYAPRVVCACYDRGELGLIQGEAKGELDLL